MEYPSLCERITVLNKIQIYLDVLGPLVLMIWIG
jgi:hypothetical protein